ncbi:MAG: SfiI family type II restriction endonuclease [Acidobacteriaceae bacterium]|nr:SfiI family type II restriction endonuclease [Acidobacteriaceae bacterium]
MLIDPKDLQYDLQRLEEIEKASLRLVVQAILDFRETAVEIFHKEKDLPQDMAEDVTREALDRMGVSRIDERLFGKIDYKRARYVFAPEYAVRQALFVDSKQKISRDRGQLPSRQLRLPYVFGKSEPAQKWTLKESCLRCLKTRPRANI